jgi:ribonuclease Y
MQDIEILLWGIAGSLITAIGAYFILLRPIYLKTIARREEAEAIERRIQHEAEVKANEVLIAAKEEALQLRERATQETNDKLLGLQRAEDRLCAKEESLEQRRSQIEEREQGILREARAIAERKEEADRRLLKVEEELQRVASLTKTQARDQYLKRIEAEFKELGARRAREVEQQVVAEAEKRAKKVLLDVMQRTAVEYVTEATLAVVELPSEDMKGRIIGREGRNIRSFEQVTGVDLIVDETPEAVVISCFDPIRRETARLALMNLMVDGRIHPGRIEELYEKAQAEVSRTILEAGERAADRANVSGLDPKVIETMGKLRFRTSYAQNVLDHSVEVAKLCENLAAELGLNVEIAKRAGFLHDIGKALGPEFEGPHALTGMEFLRGHGEKEVVLNAVGAHHHEIEPSSPEAMLVIIGDTISAARPGARRENLENYVKRLTSLETLANSFEGVERSYAVQAGREVRLIVKPEVVDDMGAVRLANEVAKKIEREMDYPGQIRVTVIRETRFQQIAK